MKTIGLIHEAYPYSRSIMITIFAHVSVRHPSVRASICTYVSTFLLFKIRQNKQIFIGLAEWIISDLFCSCILIHVTFSLGVMKSDFLSMWVWGKNIFGDKKEFCNSFTKELWLKIWILVCVHFYATLIVMLPS